MPARCPFWRAIAGAAALAAALTACTGSAGPDITSPDIASRDSTSPDSTSPDSTSPDSTSPDSTSRDGIATPAMPDPGFGHVHGLGLNPGDGLVYAATHHGVFRLTPGGPERVADRYQDTMGFTITGPDEFLGSGHPDPREPGPPRLGLVASSDRAQTWTPVSLRGEVDFHALSAAEATVYGWDSTTGAVYRSDDGGATWTRGATLALSDLDADPTDPSRALGASEAALLESRDGGGSFQPFTPQPPQPLLLLDHPEEAADAAAAGRVAGVDSGGTVWSFTADGWTKAGTLPGPPQAFTVAPDGTFLAATATGVHTSADAGRRWTQVAASIG